MRLTILFLMISLGLYAQENDTFEYQYKVTYQYTYKYDSLDLDKERSETMVLKVGDSISTFTSLGKSHLDSILLEASKNEGNIPPGSLLSKVNLANFRSKIDYKIAKNYPSIGHITYNELLYKDNYLYQEPLSKNWIISNEIDSINGIRARKATIDFKGRKWVAYYAEEIPITDGPYKFAGLPGLIIKLHDDNYLFDFELIKIAQTKGKDLILRVPTRTPTVVTKEEFLKIKKNFRENPQELIDRFGTSNQRRLKKNVNSENIAIEIN